MMSAQEYEQNILDGLKADTGKDLKSWLDAIGQANLSKRNEIMSWLKADQGLNHGRANTLVGIYFNGGKPVYQNSDSLKEAQFEKREHLRPAYEALETTILGLGFEVNVVAKKLYMSFNGKREFAVAAIKSKEIRVGMDLGDRPFDDRVKKSTSLGAMPRISHMVSVQDEGDIDSALIDLLKIAYQRVHPA